MYLPGDLTLTKAIQNDMLGTVAVRQTRHRKWGVRRPPASHDLG